jgi:hypothetical protein
MVNIQSCDGKGRWSVQKKAEVAVCGGSGKQSMRECDPSLRPIDPIVEESCRRGDDAMAEYILFMHDDAVSDDPRAWDAYLGVLKRNGVFEGGSEIGGGICMRKGAAANDITRHLVGYIRVATASIDEVKALIRGNPHFEAGGTVEIRELPRT